MNVRLAPRAREDLRSAIANLLDRNEVLAAVALKNQLFATIDRLASGEFDGPEVRLRSGRLVRSWPATPYRIYYRRTSDLFEVVRIYHQARRPITK